MIEPGDLETRAPIMGESLDGYVAAITAKNDLVRVARISRLGGVEYGHRPTLTTCSWDELPALAEVLEIDVEELRLRSHTVVEGDTTRRNFFGTTIHRADLRTSRRFFAPAALAVEEYHRALWQVRFPFDIETGEILLDTCHRCNTIQRWRHSVGVRYCDSCVEDLAGAPTDRIPYSILGDVRRVISLIHPNPQSRAASVALLPNCFRAVDPGLVLELILRLTPVADPNLRWSQGSRYHANDPIKLAEGIVYAWHLLDDWPHRLQAKISCDLATSEIRLGDGNGGATRQFIRLRKGFHSHDFIAKAVGELHDAMNINGPNSDRLRVFTVGVKEASRIVGLPERPLSVIRRSGALRTIAVMRDSIIVPHFDRREIEDVTRDIPIRKDLSCSKLLLGIPVYGLEQIVAMNDLKVLEHPYFAQRYRASQTTREHVQQLHDRIISGSGLANDKFVPLFEALRMLKGGLKPWGTVVHSMLSGAIPYHVPSPAKTPLASSLLVSKVHMLDVATSVRNKWQRHVDFSVKMPKRDAGEALNLGTAEYTELFSDLPTSSAPTVDVHRVEEIARSHIAPLEIAARTGSSLRRAIAMAEKAGIKRASPAGYPRVIAERDIPSLRRHTLVS